MARSSDERTILGIRFYVGDVEGAIERLKDGGLLMAPAAPALKDMPRNQAYREALLNADLIITDSAFMVLLWKLMERETIRRISGLAFLRAALAQEEIRRPGDTLWIMAGPQSARRNLDWLASQGITVPDSCVYMAPMYGDAVEDPDLVQRIEGERFRHIVVTIGGGTQERLGSYLKSHLSYRSGIYCIGAAIAFLSGDQVRIPAWVDRLYLGWLLRCLSSPRRYVPRYWSAWQLLPLLWRFRSQLPAPQYAGKRQ